jgi:nicotinate-nucleotide--dimethylbenzimidazole phosphoribosyltransferase
MKLLPVPAIDRSREPALRAKLDGQAKPPGSLGRLEELAVRIALVQGTNQPRIGPVSLLIFAGDHGLTEEGVSAYPPAVTGAMVRTFLSGRASANALARAVGVEIEVIDAGIAAELPPHPALRVEPVRRGTRNAAREPALTADEVADAIGRGAAAADRSVDAGADALAFGEMGIGNSASAALLMHRLLPAPLRLCIGAGAGQDEAGMDRKRAALERAAARSAATDPLDVLAQFGGCEIAMMTGAFLGGAARGRVILVDGFIASAAALAAIRLRPEVSDYLVFAHRSAERGHATLLAELGVEPLLDLGMRLGEGTGAILAVPLLRAAARLMSEVASLDGVLAGGL